MDSNPFSNHKEFFESLPKSERAQWTKKMLDIPQKKGQFPIYKADYPSKAKWNYGGYNLNYWYSEKNGKNPSALVFYFHGLNSYGGSSGYFGTSLAEECGVNVYAVDFTNFGDSEGGERGYISSFESMVNEAQEFIKFIEKKYEEKKSIYITGLSLGGTICFKLGLRNPEKYSGVIFLSPALKENGESQPFMKKVGKFMGTFFPKLKLVSQSFDSQSKFNQSQRIEKDPYIYKDKVIPGSVKVVLEAMEETSKEWAEFKLPYLMIQSGVDKLVDPFLAVDFEKECKSTDKTVIYCKDMWHAVFGEDQLPDITKIAVKWMNNHLK